MKVRLGEHRGDLILEPNTTVETERGYLIVHGDLISRGKIEVLGSVKAKKISCKFLRADDVEADEISGSIHVRSLKAGRAELIDVKADRVQVDELRAKGRVKVSHLQATKAEIGALECLTASVKALVVIGSIRALKVDVKEFRVKGSAFVEQLRADLVSVDGSLEMGDSSYVMKCTVGGTLRVEGSVRVEECSASVVRVMGKLKCGVLRVKDVLRVSGDLEASRLYAKGYVKAEGRVRAAEAELLGGGKGTITGERLVIRGRVGRAIGKTVILQGSQADEVEGDYVRIENSVVSKVVGVEVEVKDSRVETLEAERAYVISGRVRRLIADKAIVGEEARVDQRIPRSPSA